MLRRTVASACTDTNAALLQHCSGALLPVLIWYVHELERPLEAAILCGDDIDALLPACVAISSMTYCCHNKTPPISNSLCPWGLNAGPCARPCPCQTALADFHCRAAAWSGRHGCACDAAAAEAHAQVAVFAPAPAPQTLLSASVEGAHTDAHGGNGAVWGHWQG